ncbi:MAG: TM2 domain-containing protein [Methylovulum sp.]|jgi:TM2 domain-containing membrane protein YozV|nr:TM2 domain-containing protein [Methylovulum sp.]
MNGNIANYDPETQSGTIKYNDKVFTFKLDDWQAEGIVPEEGDDIEFDQGDEDTAKNVRLIGAFLEKPKAVKSKYIAALLGVLLGWLGLHRFYLGHYKIGLIQIVVTLLTGGFGALWGFIEGVLIFAGHINIDAKGRPLK